MGQPPRPAMFNVGPLELIVILLVALLVVGPTRLPEIGRSIGRGLREFRRAQDEVQRTLRLTLDDEPPSRPMRSTHATPTPDDLGDRSSGAEDGEPAAQDAAAGEPRTDAEEVAKVLGRGLAELRRAKEELRSSFRVDLGDGDGPSRSG